MRVEIVGSMPSLDRATEVSARITFTEIGEGADRPKPVLSRIPRHRATDSTAFCYASGIGTLRDEVTTFSDWIPVAEIPVDWLEFPSKGKVTLSVRISLVSSNSGRELTTATCVLAFINEELGYLDAETSLRKANTLAVSLALAVSAARHELSAGQVERLKAWARENILKSSEASDAKSLDKALDKAAVFFGKRHEVDFQRMCMDVAEIVPVANRCTIFELCLNAIRARGFAEEIDIKLLTYVAQWLDIDQDKSQTMLDEMLPATMREVADAKSALGITDDMDFEHARRRLNELYRKWHCRVTSSNSAVREQAESMLKLISDVRGGYLTAASQSDDAEVACVDEPIETCA